jgi:hypothetical protein
VQYSVNWNSKFTFVCIWVEEKAKLSMYHAMKAYRSGGIAPLVTSALDRGEWSTSCPGRITHCQESDYPLYRWLGGSQSQSPRSGLDSNSCTYRKSNHGSSGCPASSIVTILTELFCPVVCNAQKFFPMRRNVNAWRYIPFSITGRGVVEAFALLRCYIAYVGSSLPTFRVCFLLENGSDTSFTNYWSTLRNIPEEWRPSAVGCH